MDIWVGEKGHPRQRKQWGQRPCSGRTHEVFRKSKEAREARAVIKVR